MLFKDIAGEVRQFDIGEFFRSCSFLTGEGRTAPKQGAGWEEAVGCQESNLM